MLGTAELKHINHTIALVEKWYSSYLGCVFIIGDFNENSFGTYI